MKAHNLKLDDKYFDDIKFGKKHYEITKDNGDLQVGDVIYFHKYDQNKYLRTTGKGFFGNSKVYEPGNEHDADTTIKKIEYIETTGIEDGYVMLYLKSAEE